MSDKGLIPRKYKKFLHFNNKKQTTLSKMGRDFPGGAVVKNLPDNAGDKDLNPGPGRSHMPWSNWARAPQLLSLYSRA